MVLLSFSTRGFPSCPHCFCKKKQAEKVAFYTVVSSHSSWSVSNSEMKPYTVVVIDGKIAIIYELTASQESTNPSLILDTWTSTVALKYISYMVFVLKTL